MLNLFDNGITNYNSFEAKEVFTSKKAFNKYKSQSDELIIVKYFNNYKNLSSFILSILKFINSKIKFMFYNRKCIGLKKNKTQYKYFRFYESVFSFYNGKSLSDTFGINFNRK